MLISLVALCNVLGMKGCRKMINQFKDSPKIKTGTTQSGPQSLVWRPLVFVGMTDTFRAPNEVMDGVPGSPLRSGPITGRNGGCLIVARLVLC